MKHKGFFFCTLTVLLSVAFMVPDSSGAGSEKIRIDVLGMTCAFCERALEKNLSRVPGVESARAWLDKGLAEVTFKKGARPDIEKLKRAVKDGGLTLKGIKIMDAEALTEDRGSRPLR